MLTIVAAIVPIFLLIVMGFVLRRLLLKEESHWVGTEQLVYYVLFPALLFRTLARAKLSDVPLFGVGGALLIAVLLMATLCLLLRPLLMRRLNVSGPSFTSIFQCSCRWQTYVALAVAGNLYGDIGLTLASVAMVAMIPILNIMAVWVLAHYAAPTRLSWGRILLTIAQNPFIWACALGLAANLIGLKLPTWIDDFIDALGRSSLALGLLVPACSDSAANPQPDPGRPDLPGQDGGGTPGSDGGSSPLPPSPPLGAAPLVAPPITKAKSATSTPITGVLASAPSKSFGSGPEKSSVSR